jgi:hypothetical protein
MDSLQVWWNALPMFQKALWIIAVPSSVLTLLQVILEVVGFGVEHIDGDVPSDGNLDVGGADQADAMHHGPTGMKLFSVKGLIIFFTAFSWIGIASHHAGFPAILAAAIGGLTGLAFMFLFAWIFAMFGKITESGNTQIANSLYKHGEVYLRIPGHRQGAGKVMVAYQGALRELRAMTDGEDLPTGVAVQVLDVLDNETVIVGKE